MTTTASQCSMYRAEQVMCRKKWVNQQTQTLAGVPPCRCGEGEGVSRGQVGCAAAADLFLQSAPGCLAEVMGSQDEPGHLLAPTSTPHIAHAVDNHSSLN